MGIISNLITVYQKIGANKQKIKDTYRALSYQLDDLQILILKWIDNFL